MWKIIRILCIYQSRVQRRIFECILFTRFHNLFPSPLGYPKPVFSPGSPSCSKFPNLWIFQIIPKKSDCIKEFQFPIYNPPTLSHPWKNTPPPSVLFLFRSRSPALPLEMSLIWRIPSRQAAHPANRKPGFQAPSWKWVFDQPKNRLEVWMIEACGQQTGTLG